MLDNADLRGVSRLYKLSQVGTGGDPPLSHLAFGPRSCASNCHVVAALPQASTKAIDLPAHGTSTWSSNACGKHAYGDTRRRLCYAEATSATAGRKGGKDRGRVCGGLSQRHHSRLRVWIEQNDLGPERSSDQVLICQISVRHTTWGNLPFYVRTRARLAPA